jgi:hypothetical protein
MIGVLLTTEGTMKRVCMLILDNRRMTISEVALEVVHHRHYICKVCAEQDPK